VPDAPVTLPEEAAAGESGRAVGEDHVALGADVSAVKRAPERLGDDDGDDEVVGPTFSTLVTTSQSSQVPPAENGGPA